MKARQGDISAQDRHTASARLDLATRLDTTIQQRRRWSAGRGQMAVLFALTLVILTGVMMLSIDLSRVRAQTENAQRAANAAALAGVVFLPNFIDKADSRAIGEAVKNGFQNGANGVSVTTAIPDGNTNRLKVTITTPVSLVFGGILGLGRVTVSRSATAEFAEPLEMGAPDYVLGYPAFPTAMVPGGTSTQGFYLEARGPYGQQENGDAYSQYFESYNNGGLYPNPVSNFKDNLTNSCVPNTGVPNTPGTLYPVDCRDIVTLGPNAQLGGPLKVNPDRQKYGVDGYDFVIDKPRGRPRSSSSCLTHTTKARSRTATLNSNISLQVNLSWPPITTSTPTKMAATPVTQASATKKFRSHSNSRSRVRIKRRMTRRSNP